MQIVCPNCETSYQVDPSSVGPTGREVRCARCRTVWFAANTAALSEIAASHRADMAQFATTAPDPDHAATDRLEPGTGAAAGFRMDESVASEPDPADVGFVPDAPPIATADSTTADEPPAGQLVESPALAPVDPGQGEDIETVAARRAKEQARNRRFGLRLPGLPATLLALALLDAGLIGWRADIVRAAPQTASLYAAIGLGVNLRGLVLADVTAEMKTNEDVQVLLVQGRIVSTAKRITDVPRLRFAVRNGSGNEIYTWTVLPDRSLLAPGETLGFQSRLAAPPPETRDVLVRFFNRHDLGVGIQ
jgi:predicted Zn finger-like uncharacterized protein